MSAKSARKLLAEVGELKVKVANVKQVSKDLAVVSFLQDDVRYDDMYNVPDEGTMSNLLSAAAGQSVEATVVADGAEDADGHPTVKGARIL